MTVTSVSGRSARPGGRRSGNGASRRSAARNARELVATAPGSPPELRAVDALDAQRIPKPEEVA
jgi:hypothetical protein